MTWLHSEIVTRQRWDEHVWSLTLRHRGETHRPGQWTNLALGVGEARLRRPYSIASAVGEPLEFLLAKVNGGALSPQLHALQEGDRVWVEEGAYGWFVLDDVPTSQCLWLFATGTGLGPFMAMLRSPKALQRFKNVVLVHGVRRAAQLAYREQLCTMQRATAPAAGARNAAGMRFHYLPLVTRERAVGTLAGRITARLRDGSLERATHATLSPQHAHVMLCGNPAMVAETSALLKQRGMRKHRRRRPGHITTETYW